MTHEEKKAILKSVIDERGDLVKHEDRELIDMHFVDYTDYDEFIIRVNIPDWQRNPAGTLHGGMVCY
ncbi:MAG: hypothetical protein IKD85_04805, partial [Firmicutes bacterium]|nr:hypothetical protein [Bacillota bacterium]